MNSDDQGGGTSGPDSSWTVPSGMSGSGSASSSSASSAVSDHAINTKSATLVAMKHVGSGVVVRRNSNTKAPEIKQTRASALLAEKRAVAKAGNKRFNGGNFGNGGSITGNNGNGNIGPQRRATAPTTTATRPGRTSQQGLFGGGGIRQPGPSSPNNKATKNDINALINGTNNLSEAIDAIVADNGGTTVHIEDEKYASKFDDITPVHEEIPFIDSAPIGTGDQSELSDDQGSNFLPRL